MKYIAKVYLIIEAEDEGKVIDTLDALVSNSIAKAWDYAPHDGVASPILPIPEPSLDELFTAAWEDQ